MKQRMVLSVLALVIGGIFMLGCDNDPGTSDSITWTIAQKGGVAGTADTTHLVITFSKQVNGLTSGDIVFNNDVAAVKAGEPEAGANNRWELPITVLEAGTIEVSISKSGVVKESQLVAVYQDTRLITFTLSESGGSDGIADTTGIIFSFNNPVAELAAADISVEPSGRITIIGEPAAGTDNTWILPISVQAPGEVRLSISKEGFDQEARTVEVYKAGVVAPASYTVVADGGAGTASSTKLTFSFSKVITGLTAAMITLTDDTGAAAKGDAITATASAQVWELPITVSATGKIKVAIAKDDIDDDIKTPDVYKVITYTVTQMGGDSETNADTTALAFVFSEALTLTASDITITPAGRVTTGALSGEGTAWTLPLTPNSFGDIQVKVTIDNVETAEKALTIFKKLNRWTAVADGNAGTQTTTKITFTFDAAIETLSAAEILSTTVIDERGGTPSYTAAEGTVYKTSPTVWVVDIGSVSSAEILVIKIQKTGVEAGVQAVPVHWQIPNLDDYDVSVLTIDDSEEAAGDRGIGKGKITGADFTAIMNANYGSFLWLTVRPAIVRYSTYGALGNIKKDGVIEGSRNIRFSGFQSGVVNAPVADLWRYIDGEDFLYATVWNDLIIDQVQLFAKKTADTEPVPGAGVISLITVPLEEEIGYLDYLDIVAASDDSYLKIYYDYEGWWLGGLISAEWSFTKRTSPDLYGNGYSEDFSVLYVRELKALDIEYYENLIIWIFTGTITRIELKEPHAPDYTLDLDREVDHVGNSVDFTSADDYFKITFDIQNEFDITHYGGFTVSGQSYISDDSGGYIYGYANFNVRLLQDINGSFTEGDSNVILSRSTYSSSNVALPAGLSQTPGGIVVLGSNSFQRFIITTIRFIALR